MRFLKIIYRFLSARTRLNRQRDKQTQQPTESKPSDPTRSNVPTKPPAKRILITYAMFSLAFIVLAVAAWFFKGADFLPSGYSSLAAKISNTEDDGKNIMAQRELPTNKPEVKFGTDANSVAELREKVERLKEEMQTLDDQLNTARIKRYIASAQYLIDTRTAPEQALFLLQAARTDIDIHSRASDTEMNALSQDIARRITRLQNYITHAPRKALTLLNPLIDHLYTESQTTAEPYTEVSANVNFTDESWLQEWLNKIYAAGRTLIKIEVPDYQYAESNRLLLRLLITARSAVLLNEQEQFDIALKDSLRLIETMPNPPISQEQIRSILSLEISWQLPTMQQ